MIKATAGGGGRGMRLCHEEKDFVKLLQQAQQEAEAAFGNNGMYLERFVQNPRHIEFQVGSNDVSLSLDHVTCNMYAAVLSVRQTVCKGGASFLSSRPCREYALWPVI